MTTATAMTGERVLLRPYLLSTNHIHLLPAYERLVRRARTLHLAGATVLPGIYGFGSRGITQPSNWHLASHTPVIVEIADAADRIATFLREEIEPVLTHGLITLERAGVLFYRHRDSPDPQTALNLLGTIPNLSTIPSIDRSLHMQANDDGVLLRIFAGESDVVNGRPLHEAVVHRARELGLGGATVLRGTMGFGANSILHTAKILELSTDLPIVIELVDSETNIRKLLPDLSAMVKEGMITMESVRILLYHHNPDDTTPSSGAATIPPT